MNTVQFVHLRIHSEYSLVDSTIRLKPLMAELKQRKMPAVALTDLSNMCGTIKFYKAAHANGIKPICGCDIYLAQSDNGDVPITRLTLLAMNFEGYVNLIELVSKSYQHGQTQGKAVVEREWLLQHHAGLIVLSGAKEGELGHVLLGRGVDFAKPLLNAWVAMFGDRFYIELQRTGRTDEQQYNSLAVVLAQDCGVPIVATNDVMFMEEDDYEAHEARVCINQGAILDDPRRLKSYSEQQYLRSQEEMVALFFDLPSALANTVEIAKRCNLDIELGKPSLPDFPIPDEMTVDNYFRQVSKEGLEKRLAVILRDDGDQTRRHTFHERLNIELDIIIQMGFPGYFLIVMDFIQWAKDNDIPVGPGRGSGAGSLVAYALGITDLDPLEYDLLFERFLNPERVSMPDFDIDFCMENRDRVIEYVANRYGKQAVSQIITFGTMAAKAVVRDVARVQGKPFGLADKLSKLIPFEVGITLTKALEQDEFLRNFVADDDDAQEIMDMAMRLEGLTRNLGKHAGGVVIAPNKLTDFSPLYCDEDGAGLVTQYDKGDVEDAGLVKFDFLGLRTLTIIDWAVGMINEKRREESEATINIDHIDLEVPGVYKLLQNAETTGVFQLESRGMKDLIKRLLPSTFEDIIALVALFRPGPLQSGMVDDFISRKHGRAKLAWPHEDYQLDSLQPVLEPTYGIILYQEQVMQIAQVMAGYSLGGADMLRRAMGKKKPEEMAVQRQVFLEGCDNNGIDRDLAGNIFDLVEKFAGYGFNKSHSAAYALVSYQTAWLKYHYPAQFMAAVLSAEMQNIDKVVIAVEECHRMGVEIVLPDVNESFYKFTVNHKNQVVYGLGAVKGVGEGPVKAIIEARDKGGEYTDLFDFCQRVGSKTINKRVIEALVASGALDRVVPDSNRAVLYQATALAVQAADQSERNLEAGIVDMFGDLTADTSTDIPSDVYAPFHDTRPLTLKQRLKGEKASLGHYITGHPIDEYKPELTRFITQGLHKLHPKREDQWLAGMVVGIRTMKTKRGKTIAFVTIDDKTQRLDVSLFDESYEKYRDIVQKDRILVFKGEVAQDDYSGGVKVSAREVFTMAEARTVFGQSLRLTISSKVIEHNDISGLQQLLVSRQVLGDAPSTRLEIVYSNAQAKGLLRCASPWRIAADDELLEELRHLLGQDNVEMTYRRLRN